MTFEDKRLRCADCGTEFVWTAGEQEFFADKNFKNEPRRCRTCKAKRTVARETIARRETDRVETVAVCTACGKETTLPFRPSQGRPVYCRSCFQHRKQLHA